MEVLFEIIEKVSVLIAIWAAIYGIDSWRREHRGKRRMELAEDTLALFYEAKDAIAHIRHPAGTSNETEDIKRGENESEKDYTARKSASIVFVRYNQHSELFNKIHAMRYRFMALIGKEQAEPFESLRKIEKEIFISARMLARLWAREHFRTGEQQEKHFEDIRRYEEIFWGAGGENDPIEPKVEAVITEIERICSSVIAGENSLHGLLTKPLWKKG